MPGTTRVTFRVEAQLSLGERLGLIIHGEYGRLLEVVMSSSGRVWFTHPIALTTLDRVEYSYTILSETQSMVRGVAPRRTHPRLCHCRQGRPKSHTHTRALTLAHPLTTHQLGSWVSLATARWSPRPLRCWCRTQ